MKRVFTALVLIPFALYSIFWAPQAIFVAIVILMAVGCYREFATIAAAQGVVGPMWFGYVAGIAYVADPSLSRLLAVVLLTLGLRLTDFAKGMQFAAAVILGVIYVFGAWRCAIDLRAISPYWILFALAINWVGDIAAFYFGRAFGRHKLAPRISPGKSWEGAIASMLCAVAIGVAVNGPLQFGLTVPEMVGLAAICNVAGQLGDLAESAMKRGAGMKDSGAILPGHGGILDRLDSSLFTLPVVYYFLHARGIFSQS
jgi:phosphatidate cytidylyltransferase